MKHAWVENEKIRDICHGEPSECYHPEIAAHYSTLVPDDAENNDGWINGELVKAEKPTPTPEPETWSIDRVRNNLKLSERVRWDNDASPEIKTAKIELSTPKQYEMTNEILTMLVASGDISQASVDRILS